ncbi:urease accessory protein UreD [Rubrivivax rivuli]|uniref:Urease accessory protein UreD n=1 Tax=Rubrivivax rivuli TaxID=1862385 RepID=A0A437RLD2_9BURK|nr:urease accessory protein UreD [Rubrivivax rivuli]RVU47442.1 urease accessory protein UreD [Rubrivivax rivuli]
MTSASGWRGELRLRYHRRGERTVAFDAHTGPLRVLQPLYPEGEGVCHHVLVHPPGGVVGGDELHVQVQAEAGSHALLTTPGATRFYRSEGAQALQHTQLQLAEGARFEWLPMETIAYSGCQASNRVTAELAPGAEMLGWDVLALGLAAAGQPFERGVFSQHLELPGQWIEGGRIAAEDATLLQGPVGWAGHTVAATLWFAAGAPLAPARRAALVEAARELLPSHTLAATAGVTAPQAGVVVLRVLAARVEPVMQLFTAVRAAWRQQAWALAAVPPRIWKT